MTASNAIDTNEILEALANIVLEAETVLSAMDEYNTTNHTYIGGAPFVRLGRRVYEARKALDRLSAPAPVEVVAWKVAKEIAASVVQSACETDPADAEHPDTILIGTDDLETIVRNAVENYAHLPTPTVEVVGQRIEELPMIAFSDRSPVRDEMNGEQTILTYSEDVGVFDLEFFESGWDFPDRWLGASHWLDITEMWPGVTAQITEWRDAHPTVAADQTTNEPAADQVEAVSRLVDPEAWEDYLPVPTRAETIAFHERRERANSIARRIVVGLSQSPAVEERESIVAWLLSDGARLDYEKQPEADREHPFWWAADAISRGEHKEGK